MTTHSSQDPPRVLALTGGIGSGKSTFALAFANLGVPCIDADIVARHIHQDPSHPAMAEVASRFPSALTVDGRLARGSLRTVFADPAANDELKRILRPWVLADIDRWTREQQAPYLVCESALIGPQDIPSARVLVVDAPVEVRVARIAQRNPDWSRAQVDAVLALQPSREAYLAHADDVVVNEGSPADVARLAAQLHLTYLKLWTPS
jgi:dephospho-CoA kinase